MVYVKNIEEIFNKIFKEYESIEKCEHHYESYSYTTLSGREVTIEVEKLTQRPAFQRAVKAVVDDYNRKGMAGKIWRVDVPDLDWIKDAQMYRTKNGSTIAIRPDGDIVAVSGKLGDNGHALDNSEALMAWAVEHGGTKLDSFDGNWSFYRKCGFEPRTYLDFDENAVSDAWVKGRDMEEKVIFMEYTGNKEYVKGQAVYDEMDDFYTKNDPITEKDMIPGEEYPWDAGYRIRDEMMEQ